MRWEELCLHGVLRGQLEILNQLELQRLTQVLIEVRREIRWAIDRGIVRSPEEAEAYGLAALRAYGFDLPPPPRVSPPPPVQIPWRPAPPPEDSLPQRFWDWIYRTPGERIAAVFGTLVVALGLVAAALYLVYRK